MGKGARIIQCFWLGAMADTPISKKRNHKFSRALCAGVMAFALVGVGPAMAQGNGAKRVLSGSAVALDSAHLMVSGYEVKLWGAEAAGAPGSLLALEGRRELDALIAGENVKCTVQKMLTQRKISALCSTGAEDDLADAMIRMGYASADRRETTGSSFAELYDSAETTAMNQKVGIWRDQKGDPGPLDEYMPMITAFGPLVGLLVLAIVVSTGIGRVRKVQQAQLDDARRREKEIEGRERKVLATAMENELEENRGKVEAFITIYQELLETVRNATAQGSHAGEIIHQRPAIIRNTFDANVEKLQVLGIQLSGELSQFYSSMKDEPEYWTLEATTPADEAVKMVRTAIQNAEKMLPVIDKMTEELRAVRAGRA